MRVRSTIAALLTAATVVGTAAPGHAAGTTRVTLAFSGTIMVKPEVSPQSVDVPFCFFGTLASCGNGADPTGTAAGLGAAVDQAPAIPTAAPVGVDGLRGTATYTEGCDADTSLIALRGEADVSAEVHEVLGTWKGQIQAHWSRTGTVATITGAATGAATFTPIGVPTCGTEFPVLVAGTVVVTY